MVDRGREKHFLSALSSKMSAEELQLSVLQSEIAAEISMKRQAQNMSQKDFAEAMGVSQGMVSKWESGECNFTLSTLVSIASKLNLEMRSPIVLTPAKLYAKGKGELVGFPNANQWHSSSYSTSQSDVHVYVSDYDLKEM